MNLHNQKDFFSGLLFICVGVAFAWGATTYNVGTGARMGPGYFPLMLGVLLGGLGSLILLNALIAKASPDGKIGKWVWRPVIFIVLANVVFGILIGGLPSIGLPAMGLIIAIYALALIAAQAGNSFNLKEVLILASILAVGSYLVFIRVLKLQIQVLPAFITG